MSGDGPVAYGVIGVGAIAAAIVTGLCDGAADPPAVLLSPRNADAAAALARRFPSVRVCADNQAALDGTDVVLLCFRPGQAEAALAGLRFRADHAVVSVVAGLPAADLAPLVTPARDIARAVPLPSVAQRQGLTAVFPASAAASALFGPLGGTVAPERAELFEALSAATSTVAAHFATLAAIARWLEARGLPAAEAERYVAALYADLAPALRGGESFERLAGHHATPGGLNEMFRAAMEAAGAFAAVERGLDRVMERLCPGAAREAG